MICDHSNNDEKQWQSKGNDFWSFQMIINIFRWELIFSDPPEIEIEQSWVRSDHGVEAEVINIWYMHFTWNIFMTFIISLTFCSQYFVENIDFGEWFSLCFPDIVCSSCWTIGHSKMVQGTCFWHLCSKWISLWLTASRLEICQKTYTTKFLGQKFYTLKVRKLGPF